MAGPLKYVRAELEGGSMAALRSSVTKFPIVYILVAALFVVLAVGLAMNLPSNAAPDAAFEQDLQSHQDGDPPPRCRPAGQYGVPHPSDPSCKHKPDKHDNNGGDNNNGGQNLP